MNRLGIFFGLLFSFVSLAIDPAQATFGRLDPVYSHECLPHLEVVCNISPCKNAADCSTTDICIKAIGQDKFSCKLSNPEQYIAQITSTPEYQFFTSSPKVAVKEIKARLSSQGSIKVTVYYSFLSKFSYTDSNSLTWEIQSTTITSPRNLANLFTAIDQAESNPRVQTWNSLSLGNPDNAIYLESTTINLRYKNQSKFELLYEFNPTTNTGQVRKYSAPLNQIRASDLPEINIAKNHPQVSPILNTSNGDWSAYQDPDKSWRVSIYPTLESQGVFFEINPQITSIDNVRFDPSIKSQQSKRKLSTAISSLAVGSTVIFIIAVINFTLKKLGLPLKKRIIIILCGTVSISAIFLIWFFHALFAIDIIT